MESGLALMPHNHTKLPHKTSIWLKKYGILYFQWSEKCWTLEDK